MITPPTLSKITRQEIAARRWLAAYRLGLVTRREARAAWNGTMIFSAGD